MLVLVIPDTEGYDEATSSFIDLKGATIQLEHSLVSISKWESKWKLPFLSDKYEKSPEQTIDYIKCMTITQNVPDYIYQILTPQNLKDIKDYLADPATATTITYHNNSRVKPLRKETVTSELIYYWMISYGIPMECQKWNLNRLMTLLQVFNVKESGDNNNMSKRDLYKHFNSVNKARRGRI